MNTPQEPPPVASFPNASELIPLYAPAFRTLIHRGTQPALIVPIDHDEIIPSERDRRPYDAIERHLTAALPSFRARLAELAIYFFPHDVPQRTPDPVVPHWRNEYFGRNDANIAYAMTRLLKPRRIVEIGSGNSTKFFRKAITDGGLSTTITCIDPAPRTEIARVADEIVTTSVIRMDEGYFDSLGPGDFLFNDGSHLVMHGSDIPYTVLRIMPRLKPGVFVHFHDIHLPLEYPQPADHLYWGEQYLIGAMILNNSAWRTWFPVKFMHTRGLIGEGVSFWLRREG